MQIFRIEGSTKHVKGFVAWIDEPFVISGNHICGETLLLSPVDGHSPLLQPPTPIEIRKGGASVKLLTSLHHST